MDAHGFHALTEQRGGNVLARHERLNRAVGGLLLRWRAVAPLYNQRVPHWDRPSRRPGHQGTIEHAELDLEYADEDGRRWIDVTVRHPAAGDAAAVRSAARRDGEAGRKAERAKHDRYPGDRLTAFVVETPGRIGAEARSWLLAQARSLPEDEQARKLTCAYKIVSCAVQSQCAMQLRKAAGMQ